MTDETCGVCHCAIRVACLGQMAGICDANHSELVVVSRELLAAADALSQRLGREISTVCLCPPGEVGSGCPGDVNRNLVAAYRAAREGVKP